MSDHLKQFLPHIEHCDLSEAQKLELLADLWSIMESFADEAWGLCEPHKFVNDNEPFSGVKPLIPINYPNADNLNEPGLGDSSEQDKR